MVICQNKEQLEKYPWLKIKDEKVVVKMYKNGAFDHSCIIPTLKYPMSDEEIVVFFDGNTQKVNNQEVLRAFDSVPYLHGRCYTNSESLLKACQDRNIENVEMYCGWVLISNNMRMVHHCWLVYNRNSILDLSADMSCFKWNIDNMGVDRESLNREQLEAFLLDFTKTTQSWNNSQRCGIVGMADGKLYIGSRCSDSDEAREVYNDLLKRFPSHEIADNLNSNGVPPFQQKLINAGLM